MPDERYSDIEMHMNNGMWHTLNVYQWSLIFLVVVGVATYWIIKSVKHNKS